MEWKLSVDMVPLFPWCHFATELASEQSIGIRIRTKELPPSGQAAQRFASIKIAAPLFVGWTNASRANLQVGKNID